MTGKQKKAHPWLHLKVPKWMIAKVSGSSATSKLAGSNDQDTVEKKELDH